MLEMSKRRFAQVGMGHRGYLYTLGLIERYADTCELVGVCDTNLGRVETALAAIQQAGGRVGADGVLGYAAQDFDTMLAERRPDCVIVTSMDRTHDQYICRAMELGCDVITEKPMTIDADRCQRILDTQRRTGRTCTVTFNYRYSPPRMQVKDLLMSGVIGDIKSVDFTWLLDTKHGADYFRRWHRNKANSGGLLVHKATHHFDLVNWWLSSVPQTVSAVGQRVFYTPQQADRFGLTQRGERCLDCPEHHRCGFALDLSSKPEWRALYLQNERLDGYYRDRCVFSPTIDIEDDLHLTVRYASGALMSYTLNAFSPWEGYVITFNGTRGRLEHKVEEASYTSGDGTAPGALRPEGAWTRVYPHFAPAYEVPVWTGEGGHGGGDPVMLDDIFRPPAVEDPLRRKADHRAGAWSILTGIAANRSLATGRPVQVDDLVQAVPWPDYPPMPTPDEPMPFPAAS